MVRMRPDSIRMKDYQPKKCSLTRQERERKKNEMEL